MDLKLRSRHWIINSKGDIIMGEGRREILENIKRTGSINKTATLMKMSYKGVWAKIKATEKYLNMKLVKTDKRKGSSLTKEGEELLERYSLLKEKCRDSDDKIFKEVFFDRPSSQYDLKRLEDELIKNAKDSKISCKKATEIAKRLGAPTTKVAEILDRHKIKIRGCQLGCF